MKKWLVLTPALLLCAAPLLPVRAAELDEVQSHLLTPYHLPLRWENIASSPRWLGGVRPTFRLHAGMHVVHLPPGGEVSFYVPAESAIRVVNLSGELVPADVEVSVSDGSGLHAYPPVQPGSDGRSLLVSPFCPYPLIGRVSSPGRPACVAVFVSRVDPLGEIAPYRCLIPFPDPAVCLDAEEKGDPLAALTGAGWRGADKIRRCDEASASHFWLADPHLVRKVEVCGPVRLAVQTRFRYPLGESRLVQAYRVHVRSGDRLLQTLEYQTSLEDRRTVYVNKTPELLGRLETAYLEVPEGEHLLTFDATAPLYLRLLAQRQPDYLLPDHNAPPITAEQVRSQVSAGVARLVPWELTAEQAVQIAGLPPVAVAEKERLALRLVRDNRSREGGLAGTMLMREQSIKRPDYPRVGEVAEKLRGSHTFYRDLLPLHKTTAEAQRVGWFLPLHLFRPGEAVPERLVPPQLRDDLLDRLPSGVFLRVPGDPPGLAYPVPERFGPSLLRVVAERPAEGALDFFVQMGDGPPLRLRIGARADADEGDFVPSQAEAALATLPGPATRRTLSGPFSATRTPAPLLSAGQVELALPPCVKEVRVWGAPGSPAPRVAVQYRAGSPYRLSEMEYLEMMRRSKEEANGHRAFVALLTGRPIGDDPAVRELTNHWQPLLRLLQASDRQFRSAVSAEREPASPALDEKAVAERLRDARRRTRDGDLIAALPLWTQLVRGATGEARYEAIFARIDALLGLGEQYLADRLLRAAFLFDADPAVRAEAKERLLKLAARARDENALVALAAAEALRDPTPGTLALLTNALMGAGEYELALMAGLAIESAARPVRPLLTASHRLRWWRVHDFLVTQLPPAERGYWLAHRALADGDELTAAKVAGEGELGRELAAHLERGQRIRAALGSADPAERAKALPAWGEWQASHPGTHNWSDANHLVLDARGAESVYGVGRDLHARFFEATKDRPLKLGVFGPVRLKVEARPLHPKGPAPTPLDDWLTIREPGRLRLTAVNGNFPTEGLSLVGRPDHLAGTQVESELNLGPGWHEIEVAPEATPTLFRVHAWRPELPLPVLPVLTAETVRAFVGEAVWLVIGPPVNGEEEEAELLARGDAGLAEVLDRPAGKTDADLLRRMTHIVRLAEKAPDQQARAEVLGQALVLAHPGVPHLDDLRQRLTRRTAWVPVTDVRESAGVRRLQLEGWNPESPALRVRNSLIGPLRPNDQVVAGFDRFVLSVNNLKPTKVEMELAIEEVAHLPPRPLTAVYQIDEREPVKVALTPRKPREKLTLDLPAGGHSVRVWIDGPIANQYLRVGLTEQGKGLARPLERTYQVATPREPLRVAVEGPAWVRIDEWRDGVLRERYRAVEKGIQSLVLRPETGQREALFRVFRRAAAKEEREVRPRYVAVEQTPVPPPLIVRTEPPPAPAFDGPPVVIVEDFFRLGLQDLGTFSITDGFVSRRPLSEDFEQITPLPASARQSRPDEFFESRLTHRYFDEWHQTYSRTDLLVRRRDDSGPTLGLLHELRYDPPGVPLTFRVEGNAYVQRPGDAIAPGGERAEWAGLLRAGVGQYRPIVPKLAHEPSFTVFGRLMSLERSRYLPGRVDQDIFTPYKAAHQAGWVLGDTLTWTPWLDSQLWGRLALTSQENFLTPDNLTLRVGARQLVGWCEANASYRLVQFFPYRERQEAIARHILDAGLRCELWFLNRDRVELALAAEYELVQQQGGVQAFLTWHFGNGRAYRDFAPDEVEFLDLRRRRAAELPHNAVFFP